jgi:FSR family fosmidomycin resistance protein-like MFS transporter
MGLLAGDSDRRRRFILAGGLVFIASLLAVAGASSFAVLLVALAVFYPASGAFVSLTQAELMDAEPGRQAQIMARWDLAGSAGAVAGPLLLAAVLAAGGGWRTAYLVLAALTGVDWIGTCLRHPRRDRRAAPGPAAAAEAGRAAEPGSPAPDPGLADDRAGRAGDADEAAAGEAAAGGSRTARVREVMTALRDWSVVRWLVLLEVADLLVDVLTGFLALYLVDVAHLRPETAVLAVAIRLGAGLAGDAGLVFILERVPDVIVLRASAAVAAVAYPGFLLVPGAPAKLAVLAVLSAATAPWYPLLQARLYGSLPGRSPVAVTLSSAAGLAGGLGPLAVGLIAGTFGLSWALAALIGVPVVVLAGSVRPATRDAGAEEQTGGAGPGGE